MKEVLTSKNVRLGRNYFIDDSNQDISKIEGIECFYKNGSQPHKLLVVVQPKVVNEKDDDIVSSHFQPFLSFFLKYISRVLVFFNINEKSFCRMTTMKMSSAAIRILKGKVILKFFRYLKMKKISDIDQFYYGFHLDVQ